MPRDSRKKKNKTVEQKKKIGKILGGQEKDVGTFR